MTIGSSKPWDTAQMKQRARRSVFCALLRPVLRLFAVLCVLASASAHAGCLDQTQLRGVNLAGAEFNSKTLPGVLFKDYVYPTRKDLEYFNDMGMNVIRLPVRWERVQRDLNGPLDASEVTQISRVVGWAHELDMCVIIDLHNYGKYQGLILGSADLPTSAFVDVWRRLHAAFGNAETVAFGLMNEPAALSPQQWLDIAQKTVLALRNSGTRNLLLVGSGRWSGAHEWEKSFDGLVAAEAFRTFKDPRNNFAIELHQYADADYSGTRTTCVEAERLAEIMARVTTWAKQENKRLFLGEFGTATSDECMAALKSLLEPMQDENAWLGWTYWAAGAWWGKYPFSIHPGGGPEAPQLRLLRSYLPRQ